MRPLLAVAFGRPKIAPVPNLITDEMVETFCAALLEGWDSSARAFSLTQPRGHWRRGVQRALVAAFDAAPKGGA